MKFESGKTNIRQSLIENLSKFLMFTNKKRLFCLFNRINMDFSINELNMAISIIFSNIIRINHKNTHSVYVESYSLNLFFINEFPLFELIWRQDDSDN